MCLRQGISSRTGGVSTYVQAGMKNTTAQSVGTTFAATKQYDAFGLEVSATGTWQTAFGYAGNFGYQETDAGLMLLGNRYYDAETGRFLTRDPIKDGRNWYGYCENNPISFVDQDGQAPWLLIVVVVLVVIDIIDAANDVREIVENPTEPTNYIWPVVGMIDPTPGNVGKRVGKPSLSAVKAALKDVHEKVGKLGGDLRGKGKFGSPMRGNNQHGYRLDPPLERTEVDHIEAGWHINWWDYRKGKRRAGGIVDGAIPIKDGKGL